MEREPPQQFTCPITQALFEVPMCAPDGRSYEKEAIEQWLSQNNTSPMTGDPMPHGRLVVNYALRDAIEAWRSEQPLNIDSSLLTITSPEDVIGQGSYGKVIGGILKSYGREIPVAVKTLPGMSQQQEIEQFERELKVHNTAQQGADGVCRLLGTCQKNGRFCLVMKRYESNLTTKIRAGVTRNEARQIAYSLFRTLEQLHAAGVVVKDIKPENILIDRAGRPHIADFGISVVVSKTTKIVPTSIAGTFNYLAPEAFVEGGYYTPVDIWGMGCLVVEMCTGTVPWSTLRMHEIMFKVTRDKESPHVPDDVPQAALIRRCFAFDADDRPKAKELAEAFFEPEVAPQAAAGSFSGREAAERELETMREQVLTAHTQLATAESVLHMKDRELATAHEEIAFIKRSLGGTKEQLSTTRNALATANSSVRNMKDELDSMKSELSAVHNHLESTQRDLVSAQREATSAQREATSAQRQLELAQDELDSVRQEMSRQRRQQEEANISHSVVEQRKQRDSVARPPIPPRTDSVGSKPSRGFLSKFTKNKKKRAKSKT